jgi:CDGSH-type Zn-finger protein
MSDNKAGPRIKITKNGPYVVTGGVPLSEQSILSDENGTALEYRETKRYPLQQVYSLCRCGKSRNMPYCDGTHAKSGFDGEETADRSPFSDQAEVYEGQGLIMQDVENLCISARFCHLGGNTWNLLEKPDDPQARALAIRGACDCPAGRLVVRDAKTGEAIEHMYEPSIVLLYDEAAGVEGPLWVRGGIPIESADGTQYEVRNRVTLCRCGRSKNMPFCDASHMYRPRY